MVELSFYAVVGADSGAFTFGMFAASRYWPRGWHPWLASGAPIAPCTKGVNENVNLRTGTPLLYGILKTKGLQAELRQITDSNCFIYKILKLKAQAPMPDSCSIGTARDGEGPNELSQVRVWGFCSANVKEVSHVKK